MQYRFVYFEQFQDFFFSHRILICSMFIYNIKSLHVLLKCPAKTLSLDNHMFICIHSRGDSCNHQNLSWLKFSRSLYRLRDHFSPRKNRTALELRSELLLPIFLPPDALKYRSWKRNVVINSETIFALLGIRKQSRNRPFAPSSNLLIFF